MADRDWLDPPAESTARVRSRVLEVIRAVQTVDGQSLVAPLASADPVRLEGFRRLLELKESDHDAMERLEEILTVFEPYLGDRLERVAEELPTSQYGSVREWLAARGYRRVHSAALGAGAAVMWRFGREPESLWLHGNATGLLTTVASRQDPALRDRALAAGLLHNIARVALRAGASEPWLNRSTALRTDLLGQPVLMEAVGQALAQELRLPRAVTSAVSPCEAEPRPESRLSMISDAACYLASQLGFVDAVTGERRRAPDPGALQAVTTALSEAGGPAWAKDRISAPLIGARDGFFSALAVA